MRIIVVDDKEDQRYMSQILLQGKGYEVVTAANGAEALDELRKDKFDMIISDILMPVVDGFKFCQICQSDKVLREIPFVFHTATYTEAHDEELALKLGASKFIRKPTDPDEFIKAIDDVVSEKIDFSRDPDNPAGANEEEVLKLYNQSLIKKLEKKMLDLEEETKNRKKAQEELNRLYIKEQDLRSSLEKEIAKRAEFFRALVHELKTPLTPIIASTEAIRDMAPSESIKKLAENAFNGALRLDSRVNELLDISRGEMGMLKAVRTPFSVSNLLRDIFEYTRPQAENSQLSLSTEFDSALPVFLGDEHKIRQVVLNLLNNAMKFTDKGGKIILRAYIEDEKLIIEVQDNGKGISEEEQKRIFEPYNRIEGDRQNFSGLGLGLSLCKQFVELHHGKIWIKSSPGQGSTFGFFMPLEK